MFRFKLTITVSHPHRKGMQEYQVEEYSDRLAPSANGVIVDLVGFTVKFSPSDLMSGDIFADLHKIINDNYIDRKFYGASRFLRQPNKLITVFDMEYPFTDAELNDMDRSKYRRRSSYEMKIQVAYEEDK